MSHDQTTSHGNVIPRYARSTMFPADIRKSEVINLPRSTGSPIISLAPSKRHCSLHFLATQPQTQLPKLGVEPMILLYS